jgi:hypothetical protein
MTEEISKPMLSRRRLLQGAAGTAFALATPLLISRRAEAATGTLAAPRMVRPALLQEALRAMERHRDRFAFRDRIAIADFSVPSSVPRFHLIDLAGGATTTLFVAHGRGSDPGHTGWLQHFSNAARSNASCEGAFLTSDYYNGKHGRSQRLVGLDPTNNNALDRAIVIHSAPYADPKMLSLHGQLGRSQGCFAVAEPALQQIFEHLGPGRMLYSAKL